MKKIILFIVFFIVIASAGKGSLFNTKDSEYGSLNVKSYCQKMLCPLSRHDNSTYIRCPKEGLGNVYYNYNETYGNMMVYIQTENIYPDPDSYALINFNVYDDYKPEHNAIIAPSKDHNISLYILPCSFNFTQS